MRVNGLTKGFFILIVFIVTLAFFDVLSPYYSAILWAAILAVPTAIAGIYGMNFEFMPELDWAFGYPFALTLIFGGSGLVFWRFKHIGWL